jgi:hypothetical protein
VIQGGLHDDLASLPRRSLVDESQIGELIERVRRTEKKCVIWSLAAISVSLAIVLFLALLAAHHAGPPGTVVGSNFVVVDEDGRPLIRLGRYNKPWGKAGLEFLDSAGAGRVVISIDKSNAPYITLLDPDSGDQLVLDIQPGQGSGVALRNRKSPAGLLLMADPRGVSGIAFMDKDGNRPLEIGIGPDGSGRFTVRSKEGEKLFEAP